jgi:hypothetical protein
MTRDQQRFECRREPAGTWMVWDLVESKPAKLGGCEMRGREAQRATAACAVLNRIFKGRLEARHAPACEIQSVA